MKYVKFFSLGHCIIIQELVLKYTWAVIYSLINFFSSFPKKISGKDKKNVAKIKWSNTICHFKILHQFFPQLVDI